MMSTEVSDSSTHPCADAAAGVLRALAGAREGKRSDVPLKEFKHEVEPPTKKVKVENPKSFDCDDTSPLMTAMLITSLSRAKPYAQPVDNAALKREAPIKATVKISKKLTMSEPKPSLKRVTRLEQNRRAAKVSRERKKAMLDELQRSVHFFDKANATLKAQNSELERLLSMAQPLAENVERDGKGLTISIEDTKTVMENDSGESSGQDHVVSKSEPLAVQASQAVQMSGPPEAAASETSVAPFDLSGVQPGATMQAMASFQQAASLAMHAAMQAMQSMSPNVSGSTNQFSVPTPPTVPNPQQAFLDSMTAMAMQQSLFAASTSGGQNNIALMLSSLPFMLGPFLAWQQQFQQMAQLQQMPQSDKV